MLGINLLFEVKVKALKSERDKVFLIGIHSMQG